LPLENCTFMADPKEVLKYLKLSVDVEQEPGEEIRNHIRNTLLGTPGKLRYRHTSLETKLPFLGRIYFLILRRSGKLLGSIAFSLRKINSNSRSCDAWYVRYFSIQAPLRDPNYKPKLIIEDERKRQRKQKDKPHGDSLLKNFVQPYFDEPDKMLAGNMADNSRSLVYACVEKENLRSWNFTELVGFETVGRICTTIFSRYNPGKHPNVSAITEPEKDRHLERLREYYRDYTFFTEQNLYYKDNYLVWRENGEIMAGCQANPESWEIVHYPGGISRFLIKYGAKLPVIRRYIVPGYQNFITVEGIWFREGHEKCLHDLFETACVLYGLHSVVIWLDERSPLLKTLQSLGKLGIIGKFFKPAYVDIRVKFNNYRQEDRVFYYERPVYISCFDLS
jgi:hypothetical protein